MRAAGRLFEVGVDELALSRREVGLLVRSLGVELEEADVAELTDRTEGWAAGTYLAALSLKDGCARSGHLTAFAATTGSWRTTSTSSTCPA